MLTPEEIAAAKSATYFEPTPHYGPSLDNL